MSEPHAFVFFTFSFGRGATSFSRAWPMTFSLKPLAAADAAIAQKP
jgi:hypothetical protein